MISSSSVCRSFQDNQDSGTVYGIMTTFKLSSNPLAPPRPYRPCDIPGSFSFTLRQQELPLEGTTTYYRPSRIRYESAAPRHMPSDDRIYAYISPGNRTYRIVDEKQNRRQQKQEGDNSTAPLVPSGCRERGSTLFRRRTISLEASYTFTQEPRVSTCHPPAPLSAQPTRVPYRSSRPSFPCRPFPTSLPVTSHRIRVS